MSYENVEVKTSKIIINNSILDNLFIFHPEKGHFLFISHTFKMMKMNINLNVT